MPIVEDSHPDGQPQNILRKRVGQLYHPADHTELQFKTTNERRKAFNFYWQRTLLPWITEHVSPLRIVATRMYRRGTAMLYWEL